MRASVARPIPGTESSRPSSRASRSSTRGRDAESLADLERATTVLDGLAGVVSGIELHQLTADLYETAAEAIEQGRIAALQGDLGPRPLQLVRAEQVRARRSHTRLDGQRIGLVARKPA